MVNLRGRSMSVGSDQTARLNLGFTFLCDVDRLGNLSMSLSSHLLAAWVRNKQEDACKAKTQCLAWSKSPINATCDGGDVGPSISPQ